MSAVRRFGPVSCAVVLVALAACSKKVPAPDAPAAVHTGAALTEDECRTFGKELERAIATGDRTAVASALRLDELGDRFVSDLDLPSDMRAQIRAKWSDAQNQLVQRLSAGNRSGGSYKFMRPRVIGGRPGVLMRLIGPTNEDGASGVNYHDITLVRYAGGRIGAADIFIFATGEPLSQTFRRVALPLIAEIRRDSLDGAERVYLKNAPTVASARADVLAGRPADALAKFRSLPRELRDTKLCLMLAIRAAQLTGNEAEYLAEVEHVRTVFPGDPTFELLLIDSYHLKGQYELVLKSLDRLNAAVGGDPYLVAMRGLPLYELGRAADARAAAEEAIVGEPTLAFAYGVRLSIATRERNHADTLAWLKKGIEIGTLTVSADDVQADKDSAEFVKSPQFAEFKTWLAERAKK